MNRRPETFHRLCVDHRGIGRNWRFVDIRVETPGELIHLHRIPWFIHRDKKRSFVVSSVQCGLYLTRGKTRKAAIAAAHAIIAEKGSGATRYEIRRKRRAFEAAKRVTAAWWVKRQAEKEEQYRRQRERRMPRKAA